MKFTVITATFNSEKTISKTLDSLLNQTYLNFEYLIIDGLSSDKTIKIVESYNIKFKDKGIGYRWISEKDSGIYDAWNKGLNLAKGDWVSFIGSDDYYLNDALQIYNELLSNSNQDYDWIYSNVNYVDQKGSSRILNAVWSWNKFRRNTDITPAHVGSFHNKEYFNKYGEFDVSYKIAGDYELLLRAKNKLKTIKVDKITAVMGSGGVSNNMIKKVLKETYKAKRSTANVDYFECVYDYIISFIIFYLKKAKEQTIKIF